MTDIEAPFTPKEIGAIVGAKLLALVDGYIPFIGQNCEPEEGECAGWDGQSRRCQCGNRRVSWAFEGGDENDPNNYSAEAW